MPELYFATQNMSKVGALKREVARLAGWTVIGAPFDIPEPRGEDVKEIAIAKVRFAQNIIMKAGVVALDAGFFIDGLDGYPGVLVNPVIKNRRIGVLGLLRLMADEHDRGCAFKECLAFFDPERAREPLAFVAEMKGTLAAEPRGKYVPGMHWSELAQVFIPDGHIKTLAEMALDEYALWRSKRELSASAQFVEWLSQFSSGSA